MSIKIIDHPHPVDESFYHASLHKMTRRLLQTGAATAVYQAGGISNPGISDLDMLVVFKDGVRVANNFLEGLSEEEKYLFIHNLYGISQQHFAGAERFAFYHRYTLLGGVEARSNITQDITETQLLKIQIALEFIVKLRITLFLQEEYGVLRMRDLLLHVKALRFDLDFLGITSGMLADQVDTVIEWRKQWFVKTPSESEILNWWTSFYKTFDRFFEEVILAQPFFLPARDKYRISKNIFVIPSDTKVRLSRSGFRLPHQFAFLGKKFFRLQNRLNEFQAELPVRSENIPGVLGQKFQFENAIVEYNKKYLPFFLPVTSSLHAI